MESDPVKVGSALLIAWPTVASSMAASEIHVCVCALAQWLQQMCKGEHYASNNLTQHSPVRTCYISTVCV